MGNEVRIRVTAKDEATKPINDIASSIKRIGETASGVFGGTMMARGVDTITGLAKSVITTGINFNAMKEQANIAFTTMLGSGARAKSFLDDLQAFAAKTPFEFPDLVTASQRMLAMGFTAADVLPTLTAIGDAAAAMGGGAETIDRVTRALGQMQAKGKASAEEMLQLTEAGIPAWENLANKIGVSVPKAMEMVSKGVVSSRTVIDAQVEGINKKFGGMMDQQSRTFNGMLSNLRDTFTQAAGTVIEPFFNIAKGYMEDFVKATGSPELKTNLENISLAFLNIASAIYDAVAAMNNLIQKVEHLGGMMPDGGGFKAIFSTPVRAFDRITGGLGRINNLIGGGGGDNVFSNEGDRIHNEQLMRAGIGWTAEDQRLEEFAQMQGYVASQTEKATQAAKEQAAAADMLAKSSGGATEKVLTFADAMSDSVLTMAEAAELHMSDAAAGVAEAAAFLDSEAAAASDRVFSLNKEISGLQYAAGQGERAFASFTKKMVDGAAELTKAAFAAIFGRPTREEAGLQLQIAEAERGLLGAQMHAGPLSANAEMQKARLQAEIEELRDRDAKSESAKRAIEREIEARERQIKSIEDGIEAITAPYEKLRDQLQQQLALMQNENQIQGLRFTLAQQDLLTEASQNALAVEMTNNMRIQSGLQVDLNNALGLTIPEVDNARRGMVDLQTALGQVIDMVYAFGTALNGSAFDQRVAASVLQTAQSGGFRGVLVTA